MSVIFQKNEFRAERVFGVTSEDNPPTHVHGPLPNPRSVSISTPSSQGEVPPLLKVSGISEIS